MEVEKDTDLPRNLVKKIVKSKVSQVQALTGAQQGRDIQVNKDALLAFSESAKVMSVVCIDCPLHDASLVRMATMSCHSLMRWSS